MQSRYIENYFVVRYTSGIVCVIFNLKERWTRCSYVSDEWFEFGPEDDEEMVEINFPELEGAHLTTEFRDKDQYHVYHIPIELFESDKVLVHGNTVNSYKILPK